MGEERIISTCKPVHFYPLERECFAIIHCCVFSNENAEVMSVLKLSVEHGLNTQFEYRV